MNLFDKVYKKISEFYDDHGCCPSVLVINREEYIDLLTDIKYVNPEITKTKRFMALDIILTVKDVVEVY